MIEYHPLLYQPFCYFTLSPPYKYMYAHLPHCSFSQVLPGLASCLVLCPALSGGIVSVFAVAPVFLVLSVPPPPLIRRPSVSGSGVVSHPSYPLLAWLVHPQPPFQAGPSRTACPTLVPWMRRSPPSDVTSQCQCCSVRTPDPPNDP